MIPASFEAGHDVLPEVILNGARELHGSVWHRGAKELLGPAVADVFATAIKAQFFGGLEGEVTTDDIGFARGVMDVHVVKSSPSFQVFDRRVYRCTDVITGFGFGTSNAGVKAVDDTACQGGTREEATVGGSGEREGAHVGLD